MSTPRKFLTSRTLPLGAAATVLVLGMAACGTPGSGSSPSPSSDSPSPTMTTPEPSATTPSSSPSATATPPPATTTPPVAAPKPCTAASLAASLNTAGGGAAGSVYGILTLKNTGGVTCTVTGFPKVELVPGTAAPAIGAPAEQDASVPATTVTLAPGQAAGAQLRYSQAGLHPDCVHVAAHQYRVYAPGSSDPLFIPVTVDGCSNAAVKLLTVQALKAA
ncbi:MAG: DUF4232 domain-containing protein [Arthrobacter sp.]|nr:DUF4232 domain-containing protein [Arthrobacter sp.]